MKRKENLEKQKKRDEEKSPLKWDGKHVIAFMLKNDNNLHIYKEP